MIPANSRMEALEISPRFRQTIEERIQRLEEGAAADEAHVARLEHPDHIRRHKLLIQAQRTEALRMRIFLHRAKTRPMRPQISL